MTLSDLLFEKADNKCFIYINGKKVDIEQPNLCQLLQNKVDNELNAEIMELLVRIPTRITMQSIKLETSIEQFNTINEVTKTVYGIKIGKTKREETFSILKNILTKEIIFEQNSQYVSFDEIGMSLYFNADNNIVEEIILTSPFQGATLRGLKIGCSIQKAIELCGEPQIRSIITAFWGKFSVVIRNDIITSIKIK